MSDETSPPTRPTRKELKATIRALRSEVAALQSTIRNRPPVFTVDGRDVEGCVVIITGATVERDVIPVYCDGVARYIPGPTSMALIASGPFPDVGIGGRFYLIPQSAENAKSPPPG